MSSPAGASPATVALTTTQQQIWTAQRLAPHVPLANMANRFHLADAIDADRLAAAFDRVVDHCEVLRMAVLADSFGDAPMARIDARIVSATTVIDLPVSDVDAWVVDRVARPIDATVGVHDSVLIRHLDGTSTWWLCLHHIATDAWTSALIFEATAAVYADADVDLDTIIDGQYFDAEQSVPPTAVLVDSTIEPLALYGSAPGGGTDIDRAEVLLSDALRVALDDALAADFRSLSRDLSLLAISAMAVAQLASRLDGRTVVHLDTPLHHRSSRSRKRLVGPLMELASLQVTIDSTETNAAMFKRVVRSVMELLTTTQPGALPPPRSGVLVNVVTARYGSFAGIPTTRQWVRAAHADAAQVVGSQIFETTEPDGSGSRLRWEVETPRSDGTQTLLPEHLAAIVSDLVERPTGLVGRAPIVTAEESVELRRLNPSPGPAELAGPVHDQIADALAVQPDWVVAEHRGVSISAKEFDAQADRCARWLRSQGVVVGSSVAVRMERGLDVLVAIQGVLRAGGVFVMLDPDGPPERHAAVVAAASIDVVIDRLPSAAELDNVEAAGALPQVHLDDLAYILFTSGSTGEPKGVPISHRGLADYLHFAVESFGLDQPVLALHSSMEFDLTITSLFASFVSGGRVVVFGQDPVEALAAIAADDRIDTLKATPSQLAIYCRFAEPERALRTVIVGGEAFRRPVAVELAERCAAVRIFNEYGPTEAVVGCMIHEWDRHVDVGADVPIGAAAPGASLALLDTSQQVSPVGAWGELYVRRPGMASGYLGLPEQTAERFVTPSVLADVLPGPWYRTGDRARVVRPGVLVYGGRMDDQLKVGGFRLEPAEVEAALVAHPRVSSAIVRLWPSGNGELLTAWYETADGSDISIAELRAHSRHRLADHAVPTAFVRVDEMPLAASAKADPALLPTPQPRHRSDVRVPTVGPTEGIIAGVWCEVLGVDEVGATDDFFDIGGASLSAIEIVVALESRFGTSLADAAVFTARTVRELAVLIDDASTPTEISELSERREPIAPLAPGTPVPLSSSEEAMLFDHRRAPSSTHYHVARLYAIDDIDSIDLPALHGAFAALVAHHEPLHTSYSADRRSLPAERALSWTEHPEMTAFDFGELAQASRAAPFDLDNGPLMRIDVARTGSRQWSLLICLHHISLGVGTLDLIWRQAIAVYAGGALPELPITYGAHAQWQRLRPDDTARAAWLDRARQRPEPAPIRLPAPARGTPDGYVARRLPIAPAQLATDGHTPFSAAFAASAIVVSRFTAGRHVEFGIAASTKDHVHAAPLIGHHLNSLPIGLDVEAGDTFAELLDRARADVTDALAMRTYPFASIVRDACAAGLVAPDLAFMLAYDQIGAAEFPDARVSHRILASETAVTDLTFFVQERPDAVQISIEYRGTVVDRAGADRLLKLFEAVLLDGVARPSSTVTLLTSPEPLSVLRGAPLEPTDELIAHRVLAAAIDDAEHVAIIDASGNSLTSGALVAMVHELVARLDELGQVPRVGVAVSRGLHVMPALLGAQFAGAAAIPLDPTVGRERLRSIVIESGLDVLLHDGSVAPESDGSILGVPAGRCIDVSGSSEATDVLLAVESLRANVDRLHGDDIAYVVFTSGSTGVPRGVEVTHANLAASTFAREPWYPSTPTRFLVTSSIGFDSSVVGLYWPLATGGSVVFPGDADVHDVDRLGVLIEQLDVSHVLMVPTLYSALLDRRARALSGLDVVIVAGEACPPALVDDHHAALPNVALVNEYGPTEATVWATAHPLAGGDDPVPIGAPIPGIEVRVVGPDGAPLPLGVAGELWIGGPTVTPGYLGDVAATASRFPVRDGVRWYRTGDRVRLVDDVAHFVGRLDDQLNVGGVRIEPVEVESLIGRWTGVRNVVLVAAGSPTALIAHIVSDNPIDEADLRQHLAEQLPAAAVPRRFIEQSALPLSPNGKVDRDAAAALPVPVVVSSTVGRVSAPDDSIEAAVLDAWMTALGRTDIDGDTDFFAVGGNSLAAVEIVTRLAELTGNDVAIAALLAGRTPAGVAALLADHSTGDAAGERGCQAVTLRDGSPDSPIVLMVPAWDDVFGYQALADAFEGDVTVVALVYAPVHGSAAIDNVDELVAAFLPLAVESAAGRPAVAVLGWSVGGVVAVELAAALPDAGLPVGFVALVDTLFPGEGRHLWSNRWWKYKSMLAPGSFGEAAREFRIMAGRRARRIVSKVMPSPARSRGESSVAAPVGASGVFPPESLVHEVVHIDAPLVFYAATGTNPDRTIRHWAAIADDHTIVSVRGRHRGFDSIMGQPGVDVIAADLARRLGS